MRPAEVGSNSPARCAPRTSTLRTDTVNSSDSSSNESCCASGKNAQPRLGPGRHVRDVHIHQTKSCVSYQRDAKGGRCESSLRTHDQTSTGPGPKTYRQLHRPKPPYQPPKARSADHLPNVCYQRRRYDKGSGVGRRHCQTQQAYADRRQREAGDALDQSREQKCGGNDDKIDDGVRHRDRVVCRLQKAQ